MNPADYQFVREFLREHSAISLSDQKEYLVESRLSPLAKQEGLGTLEHLIRKLRHSDFSPLHQKAIEAMTTNETSFFRDPNVYEALRQVVIPELMETLKFKRELRIWSAAASTGQEAYSIAITLREHFPELAGWKVELLGTDLDEQVLESARAGTFSRMEVNRGMPAKLLTQYFRKHGLKWVLNDSIRNMVRFERLNLANQWRLLPKFDLVLLRNVLIYFELPTKRTILAQMQRQIQPHGYLLLGAPETTLNVDPQWIPCRFSERAVGYRFQPKPASTSLDSTGV